MVAALISALQRPTVLCVPAPMNQTGDPAPPVSHFSSLNGLKTVDLQITAK